MIKLLKPRRRRSTLDNLCAQRMRRSYLNIISDNVNMISLTFKMAGYGVKIGGYHLIIATLVAAYWFLVIVENTIGFNTSDQIVILAASIAGGFLSLAALSLILGILNVIYNIPRYIMIGKE